MNYIESTKKLPSYPKSTYFFHKARNSLIISIRANTKMKLILYAGLRNVRTKRVQYRAWMLPNQGCIMVFNQEKIFEYLC